MPRLRWLNSFKFALRAQRRHLMRTALALLGIVVGVAAVIIMVSMGQGTMAEIYRKIEGMGLNRLTITATEIKAPAGQARTRAETLTLRDVRMIASVCPDARLIVPMQSQRLPVKYGNLNRATGIIGTTTDLFILRTLNPVHGRLFTASEQAGAMRVAILGYDVASALFSEERVRSALYDKIRINGIAFEVIGILEQRGINPDGTNDDEVIIIPLKTALRRVFNVSHLNQILIQSVGRPQLDRLQHDIADVLRQQHHIRGGEKDDFEIQSQVDLLKTEEETAGQLQVMIAGIAAISLLVGGVGILAVMLLTLKDRVREVGVRRAIGAKRRSIVAQFMIEAAVLSFGGGFFGILLGLIGAYIAAQFGNWPFAFDWELIGLAFGSASLVGMLFGIYPAVRAARLDPITALRAE